jgi:hypothetical protein
MKEVFTDCLQSKSENVRLLQSLDYVNHLIIDVLWCQPS